MLIECERADVFNSVVVYVKAPYEMNDNVVLTHASSYTRAAVLTSRPPSLPGDDRPARIAAGYAIFIG